MKELAFAEAARPRPPVILRVLLRPYSLGHEIILMEEQNALLASKELFESFPVENQIASVMRAALVCSKSWEENQRRDKWTRLWGWMIRNDDFKQAAEDFRSYRETGSTAPNVLPPSDNSGRELGAAFLARITLFAVKLFGDGAYDKPFGWLQWLYLTECESEDSLRIENRLERQIREEEAEIREEYAKEQKEKEAKCQA